MNIDINQIRSVTRGEVNGSVRFFILAFCAAAVWISVSWISDMAKSASSTLALQQTRYHTLSQLATEYKSLAANPSASREETDVVTAFTQVSAQIELGSRVSRLAPTPDGRRCSVEINRLYAEELVDMVRELAARGVRVISAEVRALPAGQERLFTLAAVIETEA
ncbi:MAG: type II secretion system protein M [Synergistaceae bacterium]|jgi:hypothetical protein|nr:type II secretion system protein M [Synergistaceae bacterium]